MARLQLIVYTNSIVLMLSACYGLYKHYVDGMTYASTFLNATAIVWALMLISGAGHGNKGCQLGMYVDYDIVCTLTIDD